MRHQELRSTMKQKRKSIKDSHVRQEEDGRCVDRDEWMDTKCCRKLTSDQKNEERFEDQKISCNIYRTMKLSIVVFFARFFFVSQFNELSTLTSAIVELEGVDDDVNSQLLDIVPQAASPGRRLQAKEHSGAIFFFLARPLSLSLSLCFYFLLLLLLRKKLTIFGVVLHTPHRQTTPRKREEKKAVRITAVDINAIRLFFFFFFFFFFRRYF